MPIAPTTPLTGTLPQNGTSLGVRLDECNGRPLRPGGIPKGRHLTASGSRREFLEGRVEDRVAGPVLEVEVPPLDLVDREPLAFHRPPQEVTPPALGGRAAGVVGARPGGELVVPSRHD